MRRIGPTIVCCGLLWLASSSRGADWPRFRGPSGLGVSDETGLPTTWSDTENLIWAADLPGPGTSSPIVIGGKVYVTCYTGYGVEGGSPGDPGNLGRVLACFDRGTGELAWTKSLETRSPDQPFQGPFITLHGYSSSTPAAKDHRIFVFCGKSGVFGLDTDKMGEQLWRADVGSGLDGWGSASSPVLYEDLVIVNASVESGAVVAVSALDGAEKWRAPGVRRSWSSPILVTTAEGGTELVVSSQGQLLAYDPATGEQLWNCDGIADYVCPSVIADQGIVYAIGGRDKPGLAVRAGGRGDVTASRTLWRIPRGSNVSSPVFHDGYVYWVHEKQGIAFCLNAKSGEMAYEKRIDPSPGLIYASPVAADGKIYHVSREKGVFVLAAKPEYELLAQNRFDSDPSTFNGCPAVSDGQLFLRSNKRLVCIGTRK